MKDILPILQNNPTWKEACWLSEYMYHKLDEFERYPTEKWNTESKIRNAANDLIFYTSQAVGNALIEAAENDWNQARKQLFTLRSMYIFACKQKFLELEPEIVVRMDKLLQEIDKQLEASRKESEQRNNKELQPWLEKYDIWKKMQDKK